jgi:hypothetical protein
VRRTPASGASGVDDDAAAMDAMDAFAAVVVVREPLPPLNASAAATPASAAAAAGARRRCACALLPRAARNDSAARSIKEQPSRAPPLSPLKIVRREGDWRRVRVRDDVENGERQKVQLTFFAKHR